MSDTARITAYENQVELNYQLYNGLFLTLPFDAIEHTGLLLPLLSKACEKGLQDGLNAEEIIEHFLEENRPEATPGEKMNLLFRIVQYVERQVVLLDALEDAAFSDIHQTDAANELRKISERIQVDGLGSEYASLLAHFKIRVTLTAHPTQFYPGPVLAIITDLVDTIQTNNLSRARDLLHQLGNTPFFNKKKPTPEDEAIQLSWYLSNIFYPSVGKIVDNLAADMPELAAQANGAGQHPICPQLFSIGFWPGGDRDGNPFVTSASTLKVANKLRSLVVACYHKEIRQLKRRLSYSGVYEELETIELKLHRELTHEVEAAFESPQGLIEKLDLIASQVKTRYQGLFLDQVDSLKRKIALFGFHFASLDIRQDSRVLEDVLNQVFTIKPELIPTNFSTLDGDEQLASLLVVEGSVRPDELTDALARDTLLSLQTMADIQQRNGEAACHRYIISNCRGAIDVIRLLTLLKLVLPSEAVRKIDIVPLFETIPDLADAGGHMATLYDIDDYAAHLQARRSQQTVMLGFSDGTKDGGYLMANWAIYKAKEDITAASRQAGIEACFFDGRGGPPARGGGSTYKFYAALGKTIESNEIQLTVQGQSISSYYGTQIAAMHNLRQLLAAGLENNLYERPDRELGDAQRELLEKLAGISYQKYSEFKAHPRFLPYLEQISTLHYYAKTNIGSRPAKRGGDSELRFEDLRAIPFVGAWAQLKQNVPGFYGLGSALKAMEDENRLEECKSLYENFRFFRALVENSMQSMCKSNYLLTAYLKDDPEFGEFWQLIHDEFQLSKEMALKISGQSELLERSPTSRLSIRLREQIVLPLLVIQQFALMKKNEARSEADTGDYEKLIIRTLFGNINASRNSA